MSTINNDQVLKEIRNNLEDYRTTIIALQCFVGAATWDNAARQRLPSAKDSIGRRMDTSNSNRVSPNTTVTPDSVIQRSQELGYVVEVKKSMPLDRARWRETITQLEKYDDDLKGWWYEPISTFCIVLLIHSTRAADFRNLIEKLKDSNEVSFARPISVIEFIRSSEGQEYIFLRKQWGNIEDGEFSRELDSGKDVPIERVLASNKELKFYDSPPEVEHTMFTLWQDIFHPMKSDSEYDESLKAYPLSVSASDLALELQRLYGSPGGESRDVVFPQIGWIKEALDAFVTLGLAKKKDDDGNYLILFKKITGDLIERFAKHRLKAAKKDSEAKQLKMFDER